MLRVPRIKETRYSLVKGRERGPIKVPTGTWMHLDTAVSAFAKFHSFIPRLSTVLIGQELIFKLATFFYLKKVKSKTSQHAWKQKVT